MMFKKYIAAWAIMAVTLSFAAPQSAKVRSVLGDVSLKKKGQGDWSSLRVGAKVQDKDLIQTDMAGKKSQFKFKTGTMTASIRGTDGTVGMTEGGQSFGALNTGEMVMEENGQEVSVKAKQYVAFRKGKKPVVVEAKNAGDPDFAKKIGSVVDDSTKSDDDIKSQAKDIDAKIEKRNQELKSKFECKFESVPAVVKVDSVEIFGPNLPVHVLSDILGTIPYEIISTVSIRVKRVYYTE